MPLSLFLALALLPAVQCAYPSGYCPTTDGCSCTATKPGGDAKVFSSAVGSAGCCPKTDEFKSLVMLCMRGEGDVNAATGEFTVGGEAGNPDCEGGLTFIEWDVVVTAAHVFAQFIAPKPCCDCAGDAGVSASVGLSGKTVDVKFPSSDRQMLTVKVGSKFYKVGEVSKWRAHWAVQPVGHDTGLALVNTHASQGVGTGTCTDCVRKSTYAIGVTPIAETYAAYGTTLHGPVNRQGPSVTHRSCTFTLVNKPAGLKDAECAHQCVLNMGAAGSPLAKCSDGNNCPQNLGTRQTSGSPGLLQNPSSCAVKYAVYGTGGHGGPEMCNLKGMDQTILHSFEGNILSLLPPMKKWVQDTVKTWTGRTRLLDPCTGLASTKDYSQAGQAPVPQYSCSASTATVFPWEELFGAWKSGELKFCAHSTASGYSTSVSPVPGAGGSENGGGTSAGGSSGSALMNSSTKSADISIAFMGGISGWVAAMIVLLSSAGLLL